MIVSYLDRSCRGSLLPAQRLLHSENIFQLVYVPQSGLASHKDVVWLSSLFSDKVWSNSGQALSGTSQCQAYGHLVSDREAGDPMFIDR